MGFNSFGCLGWPFTAVLPEGGCYLIDELTLAASGAAGTTAVAAAKVGPKALVVGGAGDDPDGRLGAAAAPALRHRQLGVAAAPRVEDLVVDVTTRADSSRCHRRAACYAWALLLARIYEAFPLLCPHCGGEMRIIAFITGAPNVRRWRSTPGTKASTRRRPVSPGPCDCAEAVCW